MGVIVFVAFLVVCIWMAIECGDGEYGVLGLLAGGAFGALVLLVGVAITDAGLPKEPVSIVEVRSEYAIDIKLSDEEREEAQLVFASGGKCDFVKYHRPAGKKVINIWTWPASVQKSEETWWEISTTKIEQLEGK